MHEDGTREDHEEHTELFHVGVGDPDEIQESEGIVPNIQSHSLGILRPEKGFTK